MRSRRSVNDQVAEVARRRLALLSAELAATRREPVGDPEPAAADGSGEPSGPGVGPRTRSPASAPPGPIPPALSSASGAAPTRPGRHALRGTGAALGGPRGRVTGWIADRLPVPLQDRLQLGSSHLTVVALLVAGALAVTAWWVLRAGSVQPLPARSVSAAARSSPAPLVSSVPAAPVTAGAAGLPTSPPSGLVVVDVAGKVRHPGIASLPVGSRVVDALRAAGGARRGVDLSGLNLARVLVDGEQILVGVPAVPGTAASAAAAPGANPTVPLVDINTADQTSLEALPGVGPVTAQAILQWRADNGPFASVDQLLDVSGIGDATLAKIAPYVTL